MKYSSFIDLGRLT